MLDDDEEGVAHLEAEDADDEIDDLMQHLIITDVMQLHAEVDDDDDIRRGLDENEGTE